MKTLLIILAIVGCLFALLIAFVVWRYVATVRAAKITHQTLLQQIESVLSNLHAGRQPDTATIEGLAADAATRNLLYSALRDCNQTNLFPVKFRSLDAIAESDLVRWLLHPNELNAKPDEIEAVKTIEKIDEGKRYKFVVFRFRTHPPHWAADQGWLAGIAGPYWDGEDPDGSPGGVFSKFEPFDSKTPEQHFEETQKLLLGR